MKIRKIIDKHIHEIEFLKIAQLEKKLIHNISNLDILIFDRNIAKNTLVRKLLKKFPKRCFVIKGHEKIKNIHNYSSNIEKIIKAIDKFKNQTIWLWPNIDAGSDGISKSIRKNREKGKLKNVLFIKNLQVENYNFLLFLSQKVL